MSLLIGRDCQKVTMAHSMGQLVTIGPQCWPGLLHLPSSTSSLIGPDCQEVPLGQLHSVMSAAQADDVIIITITMTVMTLMTSGYDMNNMMQMVTNLSLAAEQV